MHVPHSQRVTAWRSGGVHGGGVHGAGMYTGMFTGMYTGIAPLYTPLLLLFPRSKPVLRPFTPVLE